MKHGTKVSKSDIDTSKAGKKIAAKTETQIKLSKLNAKTSYDVYVVVKNSAGVSNMKQIALDQSKRPTPTPTPSNQTKASLRWTGYSWRDLQPLPVSLVQMVSVIIPGRSRDPAKTVEVVKLISKQIKHLISS